MKIRISDGMLIALIISMTYTKSLGVTQGMMAREIYGDIWLATMISNVKGILLMLLTVMVLKRTPDCDIVEQTGQLLGKWSGKLLGIVLFLYFGAAFATIMITFVYHLMDYFLPQTPTYVFFAVGLGVSLYGLYKGLEVIARTAFLAVLAIMVFTILIMLGSFQHMDIKELHPLFESGFLKTFSASRHNDADWGMATLMASLILPIVNPRTGWAKAGVWGMALAGAVVIVGPMLESMVLSPEMTAQYLVSCMQLARSAEIGVFMHRYEMIMVAMFIIPLFVQMMLCLYCATKAISHTLGTGKLNLLYVPVTLVLGAWSYWVVSNHFRALNYLSGAWVYIALPIMYGVPVLVLAAGFVRKKQEKQTPPVTEN